MTLEQLLKLTRQQIGLIITGLVIGLAAAAGLLAIMPVSYTASAVAYVRVAVPEGGDASGEYYTASQLASQKVKAFVTVFTSQAVAEDVIESLGLSTTPAELASTISASNENNSLTITVTATGATPEDAQRIADETVIQSQSQVKLLEGESSPVEVVLMSSSALSETVKSPSTVRYLAAGFIVGLLLGYGMAFLRVLLDRRVKSSEDVAAVMTEPVVGMLPGSDVLTQNPDEPVSDFRVEESLRKLRTNLRYARVDKGLRKLVVSSSVQGEGKSTVSTNLARVMALAGDDVILIEGDMRRPVFKDRFGVSSRQPGLSHLLVGASTLEETLHRTKVPGLSIITAGDTPPNPSELLGSERFHELVDYLSADHMVIIDAPPVLPVTDAVAMAGHMDGVVLVAKAKQTTKDQLSLTKETLERGGGSVLGVVLNRVTLSGMGRMRYGATEYAYTAYGYHKDEKSSKDGKSSKETKSAKDAKASGRRRAEARHSAEPEDAEQAPASTSAAGAAEEKTSSGTEAFVDMLRSAESAERPSWKPRG